MTEFVLLWKWMTTFLRKTGCSIKHSFPPNGMLHGTEKAGDRRLIYECVSFSPTSADVPISFVTWRPDREIIIYSCARFCPAQFVLDKFLYPV